MKFSTKFISASTEYSEYTKFVPAPYIRKSFELDFVPEKAGLLICGLGFYELWLNGERITKGYLAPYISNPDDLLYYDRYDLTDKLRKGKNTFGFMLGNGMQNCFGGEVWDFQLAKWRSAPKFALSFEATGEGKSIAFEADESFKCHSSPIYMDDLRVGEFYNAADEINGWNLPDFDDGGWTNALPADTPSGECREGGHSLITRRRELKPISIVKGVQYGTPSVRQNLPLVTLPEDEQVTEGYIYDFGENITGIPHLKINGRKGQKVIMTFGEKLTDGMFDINEIAPFQPVGLAQRDIYICKGDGTEEWEPMFTFHGFRYCFVTGIDHEQATEDLITYIVMHADVKQNASFECSNEIVNRLQAATVTSDLANFWYFPTDCPHREKNGWTGDAEVSAEQMLLNLTVEDSLKEWMYSVRKAQAENGSLPGIVPTGGWGFEWGNGPAWDAVITEIPYRVWQLRGDKEILEQNISAMYKYLGYIKSKLNEKGLAEYGLGDWCSPEWCPTAPLVVTDTLMCMDMARKAAIMFRVCDSDDWAAFADELADSLKAAFRTYLVGDDLAVSGNSQAGQAAAIYYGVFEPEEKQRAFELLLKYIDDAGGSMTVGIIGARTMFDVLSDFGYDELALRLIAKPEYPSFAEWVTNENGTSLFEMISNKPKDNYSRNHHFFGHISAWFISNLAGIKVNPDLTDPDNVIVSPAFVNSLDFAKGSVRTVSGEVSVEWQRKDGKTKLTVGICGSVTGKIKLRDGKCFKDGTSELPLQSGIFDII